MFCAAVRLRGSIYAEAATLARNWQDLLLSHDPWGIVLPLVMLGWGPKARGRYINAHDNQTCVRALSVHLKCAALLSDRSEAAALHFYNIVGTFVFCEPRQAGCFEGYGVGCGVKCLEDTGMV